MTRRAESKKTLRTFAVSIVVVGVRAKGPGEAYSAVADVLQKAGFSQLGEIDVEETEEED